MQRVLMRTVLIEYFDPLYITCFQSKILLAIFLIKLLFAIDSYSEMKVKKPGHPFRWLIRKKNLIQSEKCYTTLLATQHWLKMRCDSQKYDSFSGDDWITIRIRLLLTKLTLLHWQNIPNVVMTSAYKYPHLFKHTIWTTIDLLISFIFNK